MGLKFTLIIKNLEFDVILKGGKEKSNCQLIGYIQRKILPLHLFL